MIDQDIWALMDSGMLYDPAAPALKDVQQSRLALLNEFNKLGGDPATREELQRRLFANVGRSVYNKPVIIGDDVWIAVNVFIGPGVTIDSGSVIGAGSTVLSDIPAGVLAYGTPAVAIRHVSPEERKGF